MSGQKYKENQAIWAGYHEMWQRLESLPGVTAAGGVTSLPLSQMYAWGPITVEGRVPPPGEKFINADTRMVSGHYFQAMEIPLIAAGSSTITMFPRIPASPSSTTTWRSNFGPVRMRWESAFTSAASTTPARRGLRLLESSAG